MLSFLPFLDWNMILHNCLCACGATRDTKPCQVPSSDKTLLAVLMESLLFASNTKVPKNEFLKLLLQDQMFFAAAGQNTSSQEMSGEAACPSFLGVL